MAEDICFASCTRMDSEQAKPPIGALSSSSSSSSSTHNTNSLSLSPHSSQHHFESTILSFLSFPDTPLFSNSSSFDRVLHDFLSSSSADDDSAHHQLIDRTLHRVSLLLESTKRCFRKRLTLYNSISWFLPQDLTIKVFSMLDTKSLMQVAACCTMFSKSAMDPLCYSNIDLTTASTHVDDGVLRTMIHRAGNKLRSLKLGNGAYNYFHTFPTSSCLDPLLSSDPEFTWNLLTSLHIYNLVSMDINSTCSVLSACPNLTDLKIAQLYDSSNLVLELLTRKCHLVEHLFLETFLGGFNLDDAMAQILLKGLPKLKYVDLSSTSGIHGSFLRDLEHTCKDSPLETLILRDCSLEEREVLEFLNSLIAGDFRFIRHIDVSSGNGLACDGDERTLEPNFPVEKLKEERSNFQLVAEFPSSLQSWSPSPFHESIDHEYLGCCWGGSRPKSKKLRFFDI
ncbi:hypothetical protein N665_0158s0024 [Sinapis alba]|nr:hypothetical protein N665_0158s0024 [Sinapis alba]